jgi:hypothetical protein
MSTAPASPRRLIDSGELLATLADVDIRAELSFRPSRPPNYEVLQKAMSLLAKELAEHPRNMLQKLTECAVELCSADTAGVSLMETQDGEEVFRWEALSGVFASFRNGTMPRHASPCGIVIDRDSMQLIQL